MSIGVAKLDKNTIKAVSSALHCKDNSADRKLGQYWERQFCIMASRYGKSFTPMQIGHENAIQAYKKLGGRWHRYCLPDVTIWTAPGEHHEIKHKNPTKHHSFGLEVYRFNALLWFANETGQSVMYTIHNHDLAGGREVKKNNIEHWLTANILDLNGEWNFVLRGGNTYFNGEVRQADQYFWPVELWKPLTDFWATAAKP